VAEKDEGQLLTEAREKAYRERIAELKGESKPTAPPPPKPKPKAAGPGYSRVKDA
jgi:hypothetical protein